ncbi:MAG: hypothetical protein MUP81_00670 [Dehalococcoidia bacterium]|nr:hypothetical protein [Dehalococcoidia bacterium]
MDDYFGTIKDKIIQQRTDFKDALVRQLKTEVPTMKIPAAQKEWADENMGWEDWPDLINEFGREAVNRLRAEIYQSKFDKRRRE